MSIHYLCRFVLDTALLTASAFRAYIYLQMFKQPVTDINILHAQVEASPDTFDPNVVLPPFLDVEKRLSSDNHQDEEKYSAYSISIIPVIEE